MKNFIAASVLSAACASIPFVLSAAVTQAHAAGTETTAAENTADGDFSSGKFAIESKNWDAAIVAFKRVVARDPKNADAHNYLGYAYRWTNKMDDSFKHYDIALKLDPNHKGAHEYVGKAYLKVGKPEKAKEHLAKLEKICGKTCEEYTDLAKAVAAYQPKG
jgi:tetratricopeptide (TPR) repeat protein